MSGPWLGCIADDYTGGTDVASMLARAGLTVIQCFGVLAAPDDLRNCDAVVVALKSRSTATVDAVNLSREALALLQSLNIEQFFFKYSSTFDSTAQGNIGPVADALASELNANQVLFCPAFPENGRTVYCGHLFVNGILLHESSMRHHPLTPMTDSNLLRVLQAQTKHPTASLPVRSLPPSTTMRQYLIVDAISNADLEFTAQIANKHRLLTGGSAVAYYWAKAIATDRQRNLIQQSLTQPPNIAQQPCAIIAGSCSEATRRQVVEFERYHPVLHLDLSALTDFEEMIASALQWCDNHWQSPSATKRPLLLSTSAKAQSVAAARAKFGERCAADHAEQLLSRLAKELWRRGVQKFIVAGGETAGSVINSLGIQSARIGREIAPGVPWITTLTSPPLTISLKSGNFGGPNFFLDALESPV